VKKIKFLFLFFLIFSSFIFAQVTIKNPKKPKSKNAGRVVHLKEIIRIREDGIETVFKAPNHLQISNDGSIYFYDDFKLYKFSDKGKFVFAIIRQGMGPGEAVMSTSCLITNKEIIVYAEIPPKIMRFTLQGEYKDEKSCQQFRNFKFVEYVDNKIYGFLTEIPNEVRGKIGYVDYFTCLYEFAPNFDEHIKMYSFPVEQYQIRSARWPRANFDYIAENYKTLFISHTAEYQIIKFNLEKNVVEKIIKRKYERVKYPKETKRKTPPGVLTQPLKEFYDDIGKLLIYKDKLWVITSKKDKEKRYLIDVYDIEGKYIDYFYLEFPREVNCRPFLYGTIALKDAYLYTIDEHSDGYFSIAKYEIVD